jgi:hypothetical protein
LPYDPVTSKAATELPITNAAAATTAAVDAIVELPDASEEKHASHGCSNSSQSVSSYCKSAQFESVRCCEMIFIMALVSRSNVDRIALLFFSPLPHCMSFPLKSQVKVLEGGLLQLFIKRIGYSGVSFVIANRHSSQTADFTLDCRDSSSNVMSHLGRLCASVKVRISSC